MMRQQNGLPVVSFIVMVVINITPASCNDVPIVNIPEPYYSTTSGLPITLACIITSNPFQTDVTWEKLVDNVYQYVSIATNIRYSGGTRNVPSFFIGRTLTTDSGKYRCKVTNDVGVTISGTTQLKIFGTLPAVSTIQTSYITTVGGSVTLVCEVSADPFQTSVTWEKRVGNLYQPVSKGVNNRYSRGTPESPPLVITDADTSDSGTFRCTVTNTIGTTSSDTIQLMINTSEAADLFDNPLVPLSIGFLAALAIVLIISLITWCACRCSGRELSFRSRKQNHSVDLSEKTASSPPSKDGAKSNDKGLPKGKGQSKRNETNNLSTSAGNKPSGQSSSVSAADYSYIDSGSSAVTDRGANKHKPKREIPVPIYVNVISNSDVHRRRNETVINTDLPSRPSGQQPLYVNTDDST